MKQKKIPMRKCVITGEQQPKKDLIRVVRGTDGEVSVDPTGKKNGRGVYLHLTPLQCFCFYAKKKSVC